MKNNKGMDELKPLNCSKIMLISNDFNLQENSKRGEMEINHRNIYLSQRTYNLSKCVIKTKLLALLFIVIVNVNSSYCYSSVRRSGSVSLTNNNESENINTDKLKPVINIAPMLRPERKESQDLISNKTEENNIEAVVENEKVEEFKPIPINDNNFKIPIVETKKTDNVEIIRQLNDAMDLIENRENSPMKRKRLSALEEDILTYVDATLSQDHFKLFEGVQIEPVHSLKSIDASAGAPRYLDKVNNSLDDFDNKIMKRFSDFAKTHKISVNVPETARFFGFKSFGLKKLLLPIFVGAQIVKSVLIAMFLPSILGSFGKIIGKGLSQFSGASTNYGQQEVHAGEDLDYKEVGYGDQESDTGYHYPNGADTVGTLPAHALYGEPSNNLANIAMSRFGAGGAKVTYVPNASNNFYTKVPFKKQEDFKVFHNIPSSSLLLSNYDPFYSPLLSRLDSVFQRLGLKGGNAGSQGASPGVERCREKLVCLMYASPAKYAPYSNLVSAQLSRELNELRRPTSDNQEILRFFKYMKAAKNGQEGLSCAKIYPGCPALTTESGSAAMITTYNDINKLVGARKFDK